jgi:hypothetical protein
MHTRAALPIGKRLQLRRDRGDDLLRDRVAGQWIPKREQFQIAVAEVVPRVDDDCKLFAGEIFVANPCGHHRQIRDHF